MNLFHLQYNYAQFNLQLLLAICTNKISYVINPTTLTKLNKTHRNSF